MKKRATNPNYVVKIGTEVLAEFDKVMSRRLAIALPPPEPRIATPCDLDAERYVLCALFDGRKVPEWLKAEHFFADLNRVIFAVTSTFLEVGLAPTIETVQPRIENIGFAARDLKEYLEEIAFKTKYCVHLEQIAVRIVELWKRPKALSALRFIECDLASEQFAENDVTTKLKKVLEELGAPIFTEIPDAA